MTGIKGCYQNKSKLSQTTKHNGKIHATTNNKLTSFNQSNTDKHTRTNTANKFIYLDLSEIQVLADHRLGLDGGEGIHVEKRGFSHRALAAHLAVHGQRAPLAWKKEKEECEVVGDNEVLEEKSVRLD